MRLHANARLTPIRRREMVELVVDQDWRVKDAALEAGVSARTCSKWVRRYRVDGPVGLVDRSSAPHRVANRTDEQLVRTITALRHLRMTAAEIAQALGMALSTVSGILTRSGLGKLGRLGLEPAQRYERERPGELLHIDVKKLGRIQGGAGKRMRNLPTRHFTKTRTDQAGIRRHQIGWECVHIAIDDATRLAYVEVLPDEKATTAIAFLRRAVAYYASWGVTVERVLTDNGSAYRSAVHAIACRALGIRHLRTRPYRPQTNGKAERFIRTLLQGWAYGAVYGSSEQRTHALAGWMHFYNHQRPHGALNHKPPITRLREKNNLLGSYS
jgi:transposase InsO family protein/transposase-like protein